MMVMRGCNGLDPQSSVFITTRSEYSCELQTLQITVYLREKAKVTSNYANIR